MLVKTVLAKDKPTPNPAMTMCLILVFIVLNSKGIEDETVLP